MKWYEAYRCKVCGKIYRYKDTQYCRRCGVQIVQEANVASYSKTGQVIYKCATENLEPVVVRRVFFGYETRPSTMPECVIRGEAPPRTEQKKENEVQCKEKT